MDNNKIDNLLNEIHSEKEYRIRQEEQFLTPESFKEYRTLLSYLVTELNFVRRNFNNDGIYSLTPAGNEIINEGGWIQHLENDQINKVKKIEREQKEDELLDLELSLKRFEAKIEKRIIVSGFIITFLSFIVSVLAARLF